MNDNISNELPDGNNIKPLGARAYGSIPHLPNSRMGPADHAIHVGQGNICTIKTRDSKDRVIVTEKLDGACMSVAKINGKIVALTRAGYLAEQGHYVQLRAFEPWVRQKDWMFQDALKEGERFVGEWMALAHGTIYDNPSPFIIFDLMEGKRRKSHDKCRSRAAAFDLPCAQIIHDGGALSVEHAMARLGECGYHGAKEAVEGAVWRVERDGNFDFMAKYVRHDKQDGKYLAQVAGHETWLLPDLRIEGNQ